MGDFNFRFIDWKTETIDKSFSTPTDEQEQGSSLINFAFEHLLTQLVEENTRKDKSILDLILTTDTEMVQNIIVEKTPKMSDHDFVRCRFINNTLQDAQETTTRTFQKKHPLDNINTARADWAAIKEELEVIDWDSEMCDSTVEQMYKTFDSHITNICTKYTPVRTRLVPKNKTPNDRLAMIRKRKRLCSKINIRKYVYKNFPQNLIQKLEKKQKLKKKS